MFGPILAALLTLFIVYCLLFTLIGRKISPKPVGLFYHPDKDVPGYGWLCKMEVIDGKKTAVPVDYIADPRQVH